MAQKHTPTPMANSITAGIEQVSGWGNPAIIWITNPPTWGTGLEGKTWLGVKTAYSKPKHSQLNGTI